MTESKKLAEIREQAPWQETSWARDNVDFLLGLIAKKDAEIRKLNNGIDEIVSDFEGSRKDRNKEFRAREEELDKRISKLESGMRFILSEVIAARTEQHSRAQGGMHTNGPLPRLYGLSISGLHMLEREALEALKL